jgi:light-regulated signal transduction histidine kinase (bacteriophytochrome)
MAGSILDELARDERQRRVRVRVATGLEAQADARMVEVVLRNLLSNAWKCTSRSAEPEIRVEPAVIEGQPGFRVADTGAGFDMTHAGKLFQPFERMHRQDEFPGIGIGIGLATAQRIIHRRGSCTRATAAPGFAETAARRGGYWLATNEPPPP